MSFRVTPYLFFLCLLLFSPFAGANEFKAKVIGITDGDTLKVLNASNEELKVRLAFIDAPEKHQPFGKKAKQILSQLVFNREVHIHQTGIDRYGRVLAKIYVQDADITSPPLSVNSTLVSSGAAWVFRRYTDDEGLIKLEEIAKYEKRGLWALPIEQRYPPWEWRAAQKKMGIVEPEPMPIIQREDPLSDGTIPAAKPCGIKKYCSQMKTCEEAFYYLRQCGVTSIDGDNDGVPCERLCAR
jgi:endonuclease YncB( thermonuclease family)